MYVCARFHEIPAKGLQDIKETKCYGRDGRTGGGGGIIILGYTGE